MGICADCHAKDECLIELDNWSGCIRFDEVEYVNQEIINELYRIVESIPQDDYEVIIESKIFIRDN